MSSVEVKFTDFNLTKSLKKMQKNVREVVKKDTRYAKGLVGIAVRDINDHFEKERGPKGKWKDLSPYTKYAPKESGGRGLRTGQSYQILQDSGRLKNSIMPNNYRTVASGIAVFSPVEYSKLQDEGGTGTLNGNTVIIPKRKFMWLSKQAVTSMAKYTARYMKEGK